MTGEDWLAVAARLGAREPVDLDAEILAPGAAGGAPDSPGTPAAADAAPAASAAPAAPAWLAGARGVGAPAPSSKLWPLDEGDGAFVGVRVSAPIRDVVATATRLVAIGCERGVTPIILSQLPLCGLERFGFRVERLPDGDAAERSAHEEELKRFWRIAVVIDAEQIADFG